MIQDPYADREAQKYDNPIPSREAILALLKKLQRPMTHPQLCAELGMTSEADIEALRRRLRAMERDGQLIHTRRGGYGLVDRMDLIAGRVTGHRDGYGFLTPDDGSDDIYLHNRQMRKLFDGDKALVRVGGLDQRGRREGSVVEVIERNTQQLVGRFFDDEGVYTLVPENRRICQDVLIAPEDCKGAEDGEYVLVEITKQPGKRGGPRGRVVEILGAHMAPGMEIEVAIRAHGIPSQWPDAVTQEAAAYGAEVREADKKHRVDLRETPLVTIDGEDARDFDDAVYAERKKGGGWRLFVAIADVSHYVAPGSALDEEARARGNSVYFPAQVVPMLPEVLSNGLCSLNPHVDRLTLVCEMTVSSSGRLSGYQFYEAVIRSHARLTYTQVGALLDAPDTDKGQEISRQYPELVPHLQELHRLYQALREARHARGAIDFETTETKIEFGKDRKIDRIVPVVRNDAHKLIEECMLCANVATARFLEKLKVPGLFRVHQGPKEQKLENLRNYLGELGLNLAGGDSPQPLDYQMLLESVQDRPDAHIIQTMMLRSLSQAKYTPENEGHFGLGYSAYAHFTSPIRRYPDLLVHRAIRSVIRGGESGGLLRRAVKSVTGRGSDPVRRIKGAQSVDPKKSYPYDMAAMVELGEHCSQTERRADEATWDVIAWLKCEYMQDCVGDEFEGVVSAVAPFGLFVELKDIYVEGLVHVTALQGDYYHFDAGKQRLTGERTRVTYRLGDELRVKVVRVNLDDRKIDFEMVDHLSAPKRTRKGRGGSQKNGAKRPRQPSMEARGGQGGDKKGAGKKSPRKPRRRN
ncbi:ribonuclease R [Motiliproteus sp. SC1-56]|uniref:ribonuclease R n=1 Tax=Motiliproteus sp. SC1-56 TaxID=2799565 RepID=UPI001A907448|nr:ribonuclease R [Motiliproteus sp. SC1-56]